MTESFQPNAKVSDQAEPENERDPERDPLYDQPDVEPTEGQEGSEADIPESGEPGEDHPVEAEQEVPF